MAFFKLGNWLDQMLFGYNIVAINGVAVPKEAALNFLGAGVTVVDNPTNGSTDVTIAGSSVNGLPWLVIDVTSAPYLADKTGAADCTSAVNAAMVAAGERGAVYFPAGTYNVAGALVVPAYSMFSVYGDASGVWLQTASPSGTSPMWDIGVTNAVATFFMVGIRVQSTGESIVSGSCALSLGPSMTSTFDSCTVAKYDVGLVAGNAGSGSPTPGFVAVTRSRFSHNNTGIWLGKVYSTQSVDISLSEFDANVVAAIALGST